MGEGSDAVEVGMKMALEASKNVELVEKLIKFYRSQYLQLRYWQISTLTIKRRTILFTLAKPCRRLLELQPVSCSEKAFKKTAPTKDVNCPKMETTRNTDNTTLADEDDGLCGTGKADGENPTPECDQVFQRDW
ncbi:Hypothetical predicted protein, partial [Podarcis lilfordi]